jgi:HSP20 family protein
MAIIRWGDPFREFAQLQDRINGVFSNGHGTRDDSASAEAWTPPVDIYQTGDHEVVLTAELPAMKREDIEVTVDNGTLTFKGEKRPEGDVKQGQRQRIERRYGPFRRTFSLPQTVDTGKVAADFRDGVLTIRLPLREEARARQIKVDVAA